MLIDAPPPKGETDMEMDKFIRMKQVSEIIGIAPSTLYQWQREGKHAFPRPVKIGEENQSLSAIWCSGMDEQSFIWRERQLKQSSGA